jgi:hypothetical protein
MKINKNFIEQSPSLEKNWPLNIRVFSTFLGALVFINALKNPPIEPFLRQKIPVHTLRLRFLSAHFNIALASTPISLQAFY